MDARHANAIKSRTPLKASQALRAAIGKRGRNFGTITYFYSAKNNGDIVVPSDLQFAHALLLEADETVKAYETDEDRVISMVEQDGHLGVTPDAVVTLWSGTPRYVEIKYTGDRSYERALLELEARKREAAIAGAEWSCFTEKDVHAKERLLHDWMHIAPVLAQTRIEVRARWAYLAHWVLKATRDATTLHDLRRCAEDPWELVFAMTFRLVQMGRLRTDLITNPLSPATVISPRERSHE